MNDMNGLFDLSSFENDDVMDTNIFEGAENDLATGKKVSPDQTSINPPGGISDNTKPADGEYGPKPGESDKSHTTYDKKDVSIPASTTLTADQYNAALAALKKSFKEGVQIMEILESATVVHKTIEEQQQEYTESVLNEAYVQAIEDGPIFEKVSSADKDDVKKIVRTLRSKVRKALKEDEIKFKVPSNFIRLFIGTYQLVHQIVSTRLWSVLGVAMIAPGEVTAITKKLTEQFADELGDYKIMSVKCAPTLIDFFQMKFGWKGNNVSTYFLVIDRKPADVKKFERDIRDAVDKSEDKNDESIKESADDYMTEKKKCKKCDDDEECDDKECKKGKKKDDESDEDDEKPKKKSKKKDDDEEDNED